MIFRTLGTPYEVINITFFWSLPLVFTFSYFRWRKTKSSHSQSNTKEQPNIDIWWGNFKPWLNHREQHNESTWHCNKRQDKHNHCTQIKYSGGLWPDSGVGSWSSGGAGNTSGVGLQNWLILQQTLAQSEPDSIKKVQSELLHH